MNQIQLFIERTVPTSEYDYLSGKYRTVVEYFPLGIPLPGDTSELVRCAVLAAAQDAITEFQGNSDLGSLVWREVPPALQCV